MKYKIINNDSVADTIKFISREILMTLEFSEEISIICPWYSDFEIIYNSIFNLKENKNKWVKKNIPRSIRKKISKEYSKIKIINMYDFIDGGDLEFSQISTYKNFSNLLDDEIRFKSFKFEGGGETNKELLITPSAFDRTIKSFTNGKIDISIVYVNENGNIPFLENYVENIGTNICSIDDDSIEIMKNFNLQENPEQTINCGNRCLTKSHKIIAVIENEALKYITDDIEDPSSSIRTLKNHDDVIYIVKNWNNDKD